MDTTLTEPARALYEQACEHERCGRTEQAVAVYDEVLALVPGVPSVLHRQGVCLEEIGQHKAALRCYETALQQDPSMVSVWSLQGICLLRLERGAEALQSLQQALQLDATATRKFLISQARVLVSQGHPGPACDILSSAITSLVRRTAIAGHEELYIERGLCLESLGRLADAEADYKRGSAASGRTWLHQGLCLEVRARKAEARELYARALETFDMEFKLLGRPQDEAVAKEIELVCLKMNAAPPPYLTGQVTGGSPYGAVPTFTKGTDAAQSSSTPQPRKVKTGAFRDGGLMVECGEESFDLAFENVAYMFVGKVEPQTDASTDGVKLGIVGRVPGATQTPQSSANPKTIESSYYLFDIYLRGDERPFRVDPTGTNLRAILGEDAGYSAEINLMSLIRKLSPLVGQASDTTVEQLLQRGKKAITSFVSRDDFSRTSFAGYRKRC